MDLRKMMEVPIEIKRGKKGNHIVAFDERVFTVDGEKLTLAQAFEKYIIPFVGTTSPYITAVRLVALAKRYLEEEKNFLEQQKQSEQKRK